jgi:hypothetical protein
MKKTVVLLVLLLAGCAVYRPMPPGEMTIRTKMEVPGLAKEEIFRKSKIWIERHMYSREKIIRNVDRKAGVIVASGYIDYPASGQLEAINRIQYTISFNMKEEITDSGATLTFSDLLLDIPKYYHVYSRYWPLQEYTGGFSVPIEYREDFDAAKRGLLQVAGRLEECLTRNRCE